MIEVTLSIVIGIILIAGATLLYNQAKLGAGNTRAKAKVIALQGLVEEMAANEGGTIPGPVAVYNAWAQRRPDDYNLSPWGGAAGPGCAGNTVVAQGFIGGTQSPAVNGENQYGYCAGAAGCMMYYNMNSSATGSDLDLSSGLPVVYRNYYVNACDPQGNYFWFVQGGK